MAYVAPNSTIKLLARVPLNNKYDETVWYTTASDQYGDMNDHVKLQLTQYSYQRHGRDYIRVTVPNVDTQHPTPSNNAADTLFDVNYMMFQNTNFGNKWFYAFVLDIEYINNSVAELKYEIDVMQTFMFDYLMPPVYIEREHSATDEVGDNVVEENIRVNDLVPYNNDNYRITFDFSECTFIILYHRNEATWRDATYAEMSAQVYPVEGGQIFNKIYSACDKAVVTGGTVLAADIAQLRQDIQDAVRLITDAKNTIACILQIPNYVIIHGGFVGTSDGRYSITPVTTSPVHAVYKIQRPTNFVYHQDALGTYTPLNNKLFTYPYNSIQLSNKEGATNLLRYEHFYDSANMRLDFIHTTLPFFESTLAPVNYKIYYGVSGDYNPDDAIPGPNVPLPTYSMSSFELWKAQKESAMTSRVLAGLLTSALGAVGAGFTGGASLAALGAGINSISSAVSETISAVDAPDPVRGSNNISELLAGDTSQGYSITRLQVRPTIAKQIDDYFTRYGYACKETKLPNIYTASRRPYWNYVKTLGCNVHPRENYSGHTFSGIPTNYLNKINAIWDNGIRFWCDGLDNVDNYGLDNSPA